MWSDLFLALKAMNFTQVNKIQSGVDVLTVLKNPWIIVGIVVICIVLLIRSGGKGVITFLSFPAVLVLCQKTARGAEAMELASSGQNLLIFIGGFLVIAGVNVYFHFVR
jgi:hypothetical protein